MGEIDNNLDNKVKTVFLEAIDKATLKDSISLSDIFVNVSFDDLTLSVYDDEESLLAQTIIDEWDALKEDSDVFDEKVAEELKRVLHDPQVYKKLEDMDVIRPFSVLLVGDDFEQKDELVRLDDNMVVIEDDYLKNLDKELDDFLKNLLSDI